MSAKRPLKGIRPEVLECRVGRRHLWQEDPSPTIRPKWRFLDGLEEYSFCERGCGCDRRRVLSLLSGEVLYTYIHYPEDYRIARDELPEGMNLGDILRLELSAVRKAALIKQRHARPAKAASR
jgi:hypothetical protein